ncbi:MAG: 16S rRNA (cytidine(1402)-2'-O)-methyltransferase [Acetobacteraceae bacterium]
MSLSSKKSPGISRSVVTPSDSGTVSTSAQHPNGCLSLVATPIGNLADMTHRAVETLRTAELILCEDTRVTAKLLRAHGVAQKTQSFNDFNESRRIPSLIEKLKSGAHIALVSDAGTPLLSDPGFRLTRHAIAENIRIEAIPGPHAASMALTLSGFPPLPYSVYGFLPPKDGPRRRALAQIDALERQGYQATLIWYEAPHRLCDTLTCIRDVFGRERWGAVSREMTKKFEETRRGALSALIEHFEAHPPRGEITIVLAPAEKSAPAPEQLETLLKSALETQSVKDAAAAIAAQLNLPKRDVYRLALILGKTADQSDD